MSDAPTPAATVVELFCLRLLRVDSNNFVALWRVFLSLQLSVSFCAKNTVSNNKGEGGSFSLPALARASLHHFAPTWRTNLLKILWFYSIRRRARALDVAALSGDGANVPQKCGVCRP